ncbi:MAG: preprotein translocase subunit SecE [Planctomycetes bacterium]|nr:preprotein translocase subunit SecE [Planctomycetota bacterium]
MALSIYKKDQGSLARLIGGGIAAVFSYFFGLEIHTFLTKFMGAPEAVGIALGMIGFASSAAIAIYYLALCPKTVDYLIETESEMRKVNWPTRTEVMGSTAVVIGCVVILGTYIFLNDLVIAKLLEILRIYKS